MTDGLTNGGVAALTLYLLVTVFIGVVAYRATRSLEDYILGGRRLGSYVTALSAGASDMSGWLLLGLPGAVFAFGLNQMWIGIGLLAGAYLNWLIVAPRLRRETERMNALTLPDFFEARFDDSTHFLRILSAALILFFFTIYVAAGLAAGAALFEVAFGWSYRSALFFGFGVIVLYTVAGGFLAVSWTDALQGTLMLAALIAVPVAAILFLGGPGPSLELAAIVQPGSLSPLEDLSVLGLLSLLAWGLGYFGQPHILARFMALRDPDAMPRARRIAMSWMSLSLIGALLVGVTGIAYFGAEGLSDPEQVFLRLAAALFHPVVAGALFAAVLAAVMSTVDSQLLVSSSALTEDFYRRMIRPRASPNELVWTGRVAVLLVALIALLVALDEESTILGLVAYAWAGFGAAFGPVVLLGLLWPRLTWLGAVSAMLTGAVTVVVWANLSGGLFDVYELLPGFLAAFSMAYGVSLIVPVTRNNET